MTAPRRIGRSCFIDTSAFFAATVDGDANHAEAIGAFARTMARRVVLLTSNFVVAETHALFLRREGRGAALRFLQSLDGSALTIERVAEEDEIAARAIIERYDDKDFSFTDATSFAIYLRLGLDYALSFDRHFQQFGLPEPP